MGAVTRWLHGREHIQLLLHWRWLVLMIAIPISLVIELLEGRSGGLFLLDEVFIDGMVLPITTWVVLTFAAQKIAGQFAREAELERRQHFSQQLAEHRGYLDLLPFLVRFPVSLLPIDRVALLVVDPERDELKLAAGWSSAAGVSTASPHESGMNLCRSCLGSLPSTAVGASLCAACRSRPAEPAYSLILMHDNRQVGVYYLRWQPGKQPEDEALQLLVALAPEIAAALDRALEDAKQAARVYREAQAYERRRLTQELHDSLAQQVFYLNLSLDQLADDKALAENATVQRKLSSMRDVAADVYEQIRHNLSILRAWEQVNLGEAISELARATGRNADLQVSIDTHGEPGWLSPHTCEHVYSAVREALNNVVKHAQATHVQLTMTWSSDDLLIALADDGVGYDADTAASDGHYGLTLMREAIEALQGELIIESGAGRGTCLQILLPLRPAPQTLQTRLSLPPRLDPVYERSA